MVKYIVSLSILAIVIEFIRRRISDRSFRKNSSDTEFAFIYILFWILYIIFAIIALKFGWHVLTILYRNW